MPNRLLCVSIWSLLTLTSRLQGQVIDPSVCYSDLLRKTEVYQHNDRLKIAMLSIINEETFNKISADGNVSALFKGIPFNAGFNAFQEAQRKYFELHKLNVDHESSTFTGVIELDPQASKIFDSCISGILQSSTYGLKVYASTDDETSATIQLHWTPTKAGDVLKITGSTVTNAVVEGGETYKGKLFPGNILMTDSKTRILRRIDPNKVIQISLDTVPDVSLAKIVIKPVPPLYRCDNKALDSDPDTGAQFISSEVFVADEHIQPGRRGRNGDLFITTKVIDGSVTSIQCDRFNRDFIAWEDTDNSISGGSGQNTNTAQCMGSKNGEKRSIRMTVAWRKMYTECVAIPWTYPQTNPERDEAPQHDTVIMSVQ